MDVDLVDGLSFVVVMDGFHLNCRRLWMLGARYVSAIMPPTKPAPPARHFPGLNRERICRDQTRGRGEQHLRFFPSLLSFHFIQKARVFLHIRTTSRCLERIWTSLNPEGLLLLDFHLERSSHLLSRRLSTSLILTTTSMTSSTMERKSLELCYRRARFVKSASANSS